MDTLIGIVLFILVLCILGTAGLVIAVGVYLINEMRSGIAKPDTCYWKAPSDLLSGEYKTECGHTFKDATESGNPVTDWVKYCPYCGGKVS